jgi:hypothetical protein
MAIDVLRSTLVGALRRHRRRAERRAGTYDTVRLVDGRRLRTHPRGACAGPNCCVHKPSDHPLATAPLNWRADRVPPLMERICPHGVGHPDPDSLAYLARCGFTGQDAHRCDGCCSRT